METYIVRIYRRDGKNAGNLLGIVETIGRTEKLAFTNSNELWDILSKEDGYLKKPDALETGKLSGKDGVRGRK